MDFIYYNDHNEPKAFHTLEFEHIHILNMVIKVVSAIIAGLFSYSRAMSFKQGLVVVVLALIAESLIYRKMFHWKKKASTSLSVNLLIAYLLGLCVWFVSLFALDAFNVETTANEILTLSVIICLSFAIKIRSIFPDFQEINPLKHKDITGRIISACIYASMITTAGIIVSILTELVVTRLVSYIISMILIVAYIILTRNHIRAKEGSSSKKISIFNRLSSKKRLEYETVVWQFHKANKLSDLEFEVIDRYHDLKTEYEEIQIMVEDLMGDLLSPNSYSSSYYDEKISLLLTKRNFYEKLRQTTEYYVKEMEEEKERKAQAEREEEERRRQKEKRERERSRKSGSSGFIFFHNIKNEKQLNKEYRRLVKRYHPDSPTGDKEKFIAMSEEYQILREMLNCA